MSLLTDLLSLEGLITITISSIISIKSLSIANYRYEGNIHIQGNGNVILYNKATDKETQKLQWLWPVFVFTLTILYPYWAPLCNSIILSIAFLTPAMAAVGTVVLCKRIGMNALLTTPYIIGALFSVWLASAATTMLNDTAHEATKIYSEASAILTYIFESTYDIPSLFNALVRMEPYIRIEIARAVSLIGISLFTYSAGALAFAYSKPRLPLECLRFTLSHLILLFVGYLGMSNFMLALSYGNWNYISLIFNALKP